MEGSDGIGVKERILTIRLMEKIGRDPNLGAILGLALDHRATGQTRKSVHTVCGQFPKGESNDLKGAILWSG